MAGPRSPGGVRGVLYTVGAEVAEAPGGAAGLAEVESEGGVFDGATGGGHELSRLVGPEVGVGEEAIEEIAEKHFAVAGKEFAQVFLAEGVAGEGLAFFFEEFGTDARAGSGGDFDAAPEGLGVDMARQGRTAAVVDLPHWRQLLRRMRVWEESTTWAWSGSGAKSRWH